MNNFELSSFAALGRLATRRFDDILFANLRKAGESRFTCTEIILRQDAKHTTLSVSLCQIPEDFIDIVPIDIDNSDYGQYFSISVQEHVGEPLSDMVFSGRFGPSLLAYIPDIVGFKSLNILNSVKLERKACEFSFGAAIQHEGGTAQIAMVEHGIFEVLLR